jgi:hypothetical protein
MNRKNRGLPANFGEDFKGLPVEKRINVLIFARKLLKLQREKKALLEDGGDLSGRDEGGRK